MSFEVKRTVLKVKIYGETYEMRPPTFGEMNDYSARVEKLKDDEKANDLLYSLLERLGLPKEVAESLEFGHMQKLLEYLKGEKKS